MYPKTMLQALRNTLILVALILTVVYWEYVTKAIIGVSLFHGAMYTLAFFTVIYKKVIRV